jgi:1,4-alpha-glucan branching enzyme
MAAPTPVALVLHAHLPYVVGGGPCGVTERWLHEALWECYLPLLELLDALERDGVGGSLTLSVSPPLASMLADPTLDERFERYLAALGDLLGEQRSGPRSRPELAATWQLYARRLAEAGTGWRKRRGDLLGALGRHHGQGRVELWTTAASHAYLPGLSPLSGGAEAQLRIGQASLAELVGLRSDGCWVPECGFDDQVDEALAAVGCRYTVLDDHAVRWAHPPPPAGAAVVSSAGVVVLPRNRELTHRIWDRRRGYPGHGRYREFYLDLGLELPAAELGPFGAGAPTGLKLHRITARDRRDKAPYDPAAAQAQARRDADDFVARLETAAARRGRTAPFLLVAFDAELFGHWWFEGPWFLEQVLRGVHRSAVLEATSVGQTVAAGPAPVPAQPAASSWGRGGYGAVWVGPRTAWLWRHIHHAHAQVQAAARTPYDGTALGALVRDEAIRELLLLEASDWAFMLDAGEQTDWVRHRLEGHYRRAMDLAAVARGERPLGEAEQRQLRGADRRSRFLHELGGPSLWSAFG